MHQKRKSLLLLHQQQLIEVLVFAVQQLKLTAVHWQMITQTLTVMMSKQETMHKKARHDDDHHRRVVPIYFLVRGE